MKRVFEGKRRIGRWIPVAIKFSAVDPFENDLPSFLGAAFNLSLIALR
jgi:hypothetical protein